MIENPKDIASHGHIATGLLISKTFNQENPERNDLQILSYGRSNIGLKDSVVIMHWNNRKEVGFPVLVD